MNTIVESSPTAEPGPAIDCVRCGYHLMGIADDQACPECGLLVERSRQPTEHLVDASPKWLRSISRGVGLILLAHIVAVAWSMLLPTVVVPYLVDWGSFPGGPGLQRWVFQLLVSAGFLLATLMLLAGVWMLTKPQGRLSSDASERRSRFLLRMLSCGPLVLLILIEGLLMIEPSSRFIQLNESVVMSMMVLFLLNMAAMYPLMFFHLRRLAQRVLNPRLAEHAGIVGIGFSVTLLITTAFAAVSMWPGEPWSKRWDWLYIAMPLFIFTFGLLFGGWSVLNCVRFLLAFRKAHHGASRKWDLADRSMSAPPVGTA
jgi:cytochrome b561